MKKACNHPEFEKSRGQVLIMALIVLLILVFAVLFFVDISSVIRTKMRSQTALDAAALSGAKWQKHSLNLVGEMNLIKATTVLVEQIEPVCADHTALTPEDVVASSDLISTMQARISFTGPLIGFGAAQQAAKNNGLYAKKSYNQVLTDHTELISNREGPYENLDEEIPGDPNVIGDGYQWREPYVSMIQEVAMQGVAVSCYAEFINMGYAPSFLYDKSFYVNVNTKNWCGLRGLYSMEDSNSEIFEGFWWYDFIEEVTPESNFVEESEYLPLDIEYSTGQDIYANASNEAKFDTLVASNGWTKLTDEFDLYNPGDAADTDSKINPLPYITWATYGSSWSTYAPAAEFFTDQWVSSPIKDCYNYGGAVSIMAVQVKPETLSGYWGWEPGKDPNSMNPENVGDVFDTETNYEERVAFAEGQLREALDFIKVYALAKPLGSLDDAEEYRPNAINMILPVFNKVTIMPVATDARGANDEFLDWSWYIWRTKCLPQLRSITENPSGDPLVEFKEWVYDNYGYEYNYYIRALELWSTKSFRDEGRAWLETLVTVPLRDEDGNLVDENGDPLEDGEPPVYVQKPRKELCNPPRPRGGRSPDGPGRIGS